MVGGAAGWDGLLHRKGCRVSGATWWATLEVGGVKGRVACRKRTLYQTIYL